MTDLAPSATPAVTAYTDVRELVAQTPEDRQRLEKLADYLDNWHPPAFVKLTGRVTRTQEPIAAHAIRDLLYTLHATEADAARARECVAGLEAQLLAARCRVAVLLDAATCVADPAYAARSQAYPAGSLWDAIVQLADVTRSVRAALASDDGSVS